MGPTGVDQQIVDMLKEHGHDGFADRGKTHFKTLHINETVLFDKMHVGSSRCDTFTGFHP
jgi:hypothetical protein